MRDGRWIRMLVALAGLFALTTTGAALPQRHEYQQALHAYLAALTEADFEVTPTALPADFTALTDEQRYQAWLCAQAGELVHVAGRWAPPAAFLLKTIEGAAAIQRPVLDVFNMAALTEWQHPVNPYYQCRGLRRRAFVTAVIDLVMLDDLHERVPKSDANRSDYLGGSLIWLAAAGRAAQDDLPPAVRTAYGAGLRKMASRLREWGPKGLMTDMDLFAPVGLCYAAQATGDPELAALARDYARPLFTDPKYFNQAGYFVDNQCFDTSYNGISLFFSSWGALAGGWPEARQAVDRAYRLKSYLYLPEPDGASYQGPSHCSSRTSADPPHDQWAWAFRNLGAAMVTEHALPFITLPTAAELAAAPAGLAAALTAPAPAAAPALAANPWIETHWVRTNFGAIHYVPGSYPKLAKLLAEGGPACRLPFTRAEPFLEAFERIFLIAKRPGYGAIIHTGPVSRDDGRWHRPMGFGGGALSGFWTPATGPVLLGRRRGIQGRTFDVYEEWRIWATHAVTGITKAGKVVSSARIQQPEVAYDVQANGAVVKVSGAMPKEHAQGEVLKGTMQYARTFTVTDDGLRITSSLTGDGKDELAELYEVLPVFLGDGYLQLPEQARTVAIDLRIGDRWLAATPESQADVTAVRVTRAKGAIVIRFTAPRRVRLSPEAWVDGFQTQATCRNVMIDLLSPAAGPWQVEYTLAPAAR